MSEPSIKLVEWTWPDATTYICKALIRYEPDYTSDNCNGYYVAYCENLPGVVTQGETYEEALSNLKDAFKAVIETYLEDGEKIPWADCSVERWEREVSLSIEI